MSVEPILTSPGPLGLMTEIDLTLGELAFPDPPGLPSAPAESAPAMGANEWWASSMERLWSDKTLEKEKIFYYKPR